MPIGGAQIIEELGAAIADSVPDGKEGGIWRVIRLCLAYLLPLIPIGYLFLWIAGDL